MALGAGSVLLIAALVGCNAVDDNATVPLVSTIGADAANSLAESPAASSTSSSLRSTLSNSSNPSSAVTSVSTDDPSGPATAIVEGTAEASDLPTLPVITAEPSQTSIPVTTAPPQRILLPTLGVEAPVVPVGVESDGLMQIPEDVGTVGWYQYGASPGDSIGSAVLTGHVNDRNQGLGVFAQIGDLSPGDTLQVVDSIGTTRTFSVIARETWPKPEVPLDRLFDRTGEPRLVLITCGGIFDRSSGNYEDNIAVTAVPVAP